MSDPLLTPDDAAAFLRIPVKGVHALCRAGKLDFIRVNGKERRFTNDMLERYVQVQTVSRKKPVDTKEPKEVILTPKTQQRGGNKSFGSTRTDLLEEMRSWH